MNITKLIVAFIGFTLLFSCNKDTIPEPFDHAGQAIEDDATLKSFLETHYYTPPTNTEHFGTVKPIANGETPLLNQVTTQEVTYADINYKIYYLKNLPEGINISPTKVDSALVNYKGLLLTTLTEDSDERKVFDSNNHYTFWAQLYGKVIPGWTYALPNFKSGTNTSVEDMPLSFENTGKGVIFMPSGLAYRNLGSGAIPPNAPIMFHIEMADVKRTDQDRDGIISFFEDLDGDFEFTNDDTDDDNIANFIDTDDDGDFILTKYENADPNNDGNPSDAIDTDGDLTPDYLDDDDDNDGILTKYENADPNNDGNPSDAQDSDGDNIPDYLDAN